MNAEPGRRYWAIAVVASLALHAGAAGAAAMLFESYRHDASRTDFVFSDAPAPVAARAATAAEHVAALKQNSETAERAVPAKAARLNPNEAATAAAVQRPLAQSAVVSKASPSTAATIRPKSTVETITQAASSRAGKPNDISRVEPSGARRVTPAANEDIASAVDAAEKIAPAAQVPIAPSDSVRVAIAPSAGEAIAVDIKGQGASPALPPAIAPVVGAKAEIVGPSTDWAAPVATPVPSSPATAVARVPASREPSQASRAEAKAAAPARIARPGRPAAERLSPVAAPLKLEAVQPAEPPLGTALLAPERPGLGGGSASSRHDPYRDAVEFVRSFDGGDCFAALPKGFDGLEFRTFAAEEARAAAFAQAYAEISAEPAKIWSGELARTQCDALGFIRNSKGYPAFSLSLRLDAPEVPSGSALSGSIFDAGGQRLHLLLVDDEGRVQLADEFVSVASPTERRFRLPVFLTDGPVRTQQLLIAIASDRDLPMLRDEVDHSAGEFFARLAREVASGQAELDIAAEAFSVR